MELNKPKVTHNGEECELLSMKEFKEKINDPGLPTPTIHYAISKNQLDHVVMGNIKYIVWNEKAQNYKPDGGGRTRNTSRLQL